MLVLYAKCAPSSRKTKPNAPSGAKQTRRDHYTAFEVRERRTLASAHASQLPTSLVALESRVCSLLTP